MIHGTHSIPRLIEESTCRNSEDVRFTEIDIYKIHSTSLMPFIPFGYADVWKEDIDDSFLENDEETKPILAKYIYLQNFLSTQYVGRAPLEYYSSGDYTKMGREFILICREGMPTPEYRVFGTEAAIRGYNRDASEYIKLPGGV